MKFLAKNQNGSILVTIIIVMPFFIIITAAFLQQSVSNYRVARQDSYRTQAQFAADGAIDISMEKINQDSSWTGTVGEQPMHNDGKVRTTYQSVVTSSGSSNKTITATGRTYSPVSSTTPRSKITINVALRPVRSGDYSVVSGVGGLVMKNSAKVVNGSVFVNGKLTMSNSAQIGLAILPVGVKVAHQSCPAGATPGPTYPRVCASGENGQPISISNPAHIYGRVEATNQTNGASMTNTGLVSGSSVSPVTLPDYDRAAQKAAVANNLTGAGASCSVGLKTWEANTKITGNVSLSLACIVTVKGNIWITGNFDMRNLSQLVVSPSLTESPVIMIDGSSGFSQAQASALLPSLSLKGFKIITYYNATGDPDATVTGTNLYNSQGATTIDLENTASGLQTEYYARWSKIIVGNSGSVGAIAGQTVELSNTAAITLGTSVSGFGNTIWLIDSYRRTFN